MMKMVLGYKCFNGDLTNNYGFQFEVGKSYSVSGVIKFGTNGNGFHMCQNIEDTFRFYGVMNTDICVCEVLGTGEMVSFYDEYNGYYDMYSVSTIEILRRLDRTEIVDMALLMRDNRLVRFVSTFKLTLEEISLFKEKFYNYPQVIDAIAYYQEGDLEVYKRKYSLKRSI